MIEIKFRAWDGLNKKFTYWSINDLCTWDTKEDEKPSPFDEWQQYTGLKDKNGKEIYEADLLLDGSSIAEVKFGEYREYCDDGGFDIYFTGFYLKPISHSYPEGGFDSKITESLEVIGNIYENPDLLP